MSIVSIFEYYQKPSTSRSLYQILKQIKAGHFAEWIDELRYYYEEDLDAHFRNHKMTTPSFSVAGNFKLYKGEKQMISYSGHVVLEIPFLPEEDMLSIRKLIKEDPHIVAFFTNALGTGLNIILKTGTTLASHGKAFYHIKRNYEAVIGVNNISIEGASVEHLTMISFDPKCHINYEAVAFPPMLKHVHLG